MRERTLIQRLVVCRWVLTGVLLGTLVPSARAAFDLDEVAAKAKQVAEAPYQDPKGQVPDWMLKMSYDQWRDIRFRPDRALWREAKSNFQVQFFHAGLYYDRTIAVNIVDSQGVRPLPFSPSQFDYGKNDFASRIPQDLGYAGFRIHFPIKTPEYHDEVIVFLGASYFRALGKNDVFGLSARGIAIDTAQASGEEFPYFKEFWLVRPAPNAKEMVLYALLDGPRVTGAYRFVIVPGEQTSVDVESRIFLRKEVAKLGVAPLTSMFFHGENTTRWFEDFRPEVHDSDGLLLHFDSGEWLWRALENPPRVHVSGFLMRNPRGFGLLQRDRAFDHYQDLETRTELRPSVWMEPRGDWGEGRVELIELPTDTDIHDNVVMYWVPRLMPKPLEPLSLAYTMYWYDDDAARPPGGRAVSTRRDRGTAEKAQRFVIDFESKQLNGLTADKPVRGVVTVAGGEQSAAIVDQHVVKNPATGAWRLVFQVRPKDEDPVELRAFLELDGEALTETWSYAMLP